MYALQFIMRRCGGAATFPTRFRIETITKIIIREYDIYL